MVRRRTGKDFLGEDRMLPEIAEVIPVVLPVAFPAKEPAEDDPSLVADTAKVTTQI